MSSIFGVGFKADECEDFVCSLEAANNFLDGKLENFSEPDDDTENGVICPGKMVVWDTESTDNLSNLVKISKDRLSLISQSAFSTLKANACVFAGRFMYEVQLKSKGVMQIGFCSAQCRFTQDTGVGDTKSSYGLDGSKKRLWHVYTKNYGPYWRSGDIFGVCLDMDKGIIEYYRNGVALGHAFEDIERGPGLALFPAVSLAFNDSMTANFGGSPFRYPVAGYKPLQSPPHKFLYQADFLLEYLVNISRLLSSNQKNASKVPNSPTEISIDSFYMLIANAIVERIVPLLLNSYIVEEKVIKIIRSMCVLKSTSDALIQPGEANSTLEAFLSLLWTNMEESEIKIFLKRLLNFLSNTFKETPTDLEYESQRKIIVILTCLCNHQQTRKYFLEHKFFKKNCLPLFLYIKPPDESTLELLLPDDSIWTEGLGGDKSIYLAACEKLKSYTSILYYLQKKLIMTMLNNSDGSDDSPSSRKIFMSRFRTFTLDNLSVSLLLNVSTAETNEFESLRLHSTRQRNPQSDSRCFAFCLTSLNSFTTMRTPVSNISQSTTNSSSTGRSATDLSTESEAFCLTSTKFLRKSSPMHLDLTTNRSFSRKNPRISSATSTRRCSSYRITLGVTRWCETSSAIRITTFQSLQETSTITNQSARSSTAPSFSITVSLTNTSS